MNKIIILTFCLILTSKFYCQEFGNSKKEQFSIHAQTTVINQYKPGFSAKYNGENSLSTAEESQTSISSTLFLGCKLWKGASIFLNPEIAGGSGLSQALGIGAATNGETFRVGTAEPKLYVARLFFKQIFALSNDYNTVATDFNQLAGELPTKYFSFTIGKLSNADSFDKNQFSHDPRTQFMSWALMDYGAWDYAANVRGYTPSIVFEYVSPKNEIRYGISLVPLTANSGDMNWDLQKASAHTIEYTHRHTLNNQPGAVRFLAFYNTANMGNYRESITLNPQNPNIIDTRSYGNTKYGFGINAEQNITDNVGLFFRGSWNDGKHETWAFTEIDHSLSAGLSIMGTKWKRNNDNLGLAFVSSGLSSPHRDYLKAGGKGFMLGDGNLSYAWEHLAECYYKLELVPSSIYLTGTYQFLINPGFNADRSGPVNIFSLRLHARI